MIRRLILVIIEMIIINVIITAIAFVIIAIAIIILLSSAILQSSRIACRVLSPSVFQQLVDVPSAWFPLPRPQNQRQNHTEARGS